MAETARERLIALRDRIAKATGPDRELDRGIAEMLGWTDLTLEYTQLSAGSPQEWFGYVPGTADEEGDLEYRQTLPWTASLDAAVTLVPEECGLRMNLRAARADLVRPRWHDIEVAAKTLCLAVCLARVEYELAKEPTNV